MTAGCGIVTRALILLCHYHSYHLFISYFVYLFQVYQFTVVTILKLVLILKNPLDFIVQSGQKSLMTGLRVKVKIL